MRHRQRTRETVRNRFPLHQSFSEAPDEETPLLSDENIVGRDKRIQSAFFMNRTVYWKNGVKKIRENDRASLEYSK